jgi:hypothetical protein
MILVSVPHLPASALLGRPGDVLFDTFEMRGKLIPSIALFAVLADALQAKLFLELLDMHLIARNRLLVACDLPILFRNRLLQLRNDRGRNRIERCTQR